MHVNDVFRKKVQISTVHSDTLDGKYSNAISTVMPKLKYCVLNFYYAFYPLLNFSEKLREVKKYYPKVSPLDF